MEASFSSSTPSCRAGSLRYIWRKDDTLKSVSAAFGTTVSAMIEVNPTVDFMTVAEGTVVCIPSRALTCPDSDLYVIQSGDTLYAIAMRYGITAAELMEMNPYVEPTRLSIGQYICVPKKQEEPPKQEESCTHPSESEPECNTLAQTERACSASETVKCGQTLYDILAKYGMSFSEFAALNPRLTQQSLLPGQTFYYPLRACACANGGKFRIRSGDTIASISAGMGITPSELLRRNPNLKPSEFTSGTEICLTYPNN